MNYDNFNKDEDSNNRDKEEILVGKINLDEAENLRNVWGVFRDRRTDLYKDLLHLDGSN